MSAVHLRRIDPKRNMRRFYRLDVQPDLFGGVLLFKEWERIGARGRMVTESTLPPPPLRNGKPNASGGRIMSFKS